MTEPALPTTHPMMTCGHVANGQRILPDGGSVPCCVLCVGVRPSEVDECPPSLEGRTSRCSYFKPEWKCPTPECAKAPHCPPTRHEQHGGNYPSEAPSSSSLPFFGDKPDKPFDQHFCGCWGWD